MTDRLPQRVELLNRRLELVAGISTLNAEALRHIQSLGAVEIEILRIELEVQRNGGGEELAQNLREAEGNADAIRAAQEDCEARIISVEMEVEEIDLLLASIDEE